MIPDEAIDAAHSVISAEPNRSETKEALEAALPALLEWIGENVLASMDSKAPGNALPPTYHEGWGSARKAAEFAFRPQFIVPSDERGDNPD